MGYKGSPLHAILCLAENAVSAKATRPDDIHVMYSGALMWVCRLFGRS